jgi:hypothetical protein
MAAPNPTTCETNPMTTPNPGASSPARRLTRWQIDTAKRILLKKGLIPPNARTKAGHSELTELYLKRQRLLLAKTHNRLPMRKGPRPKMERDRRAMLLSQLRDICTELNLPFPDRDYSETARKRESRTIQKLKYRPLSDVTVTQHAKAFDHAHGRIILGGGGDATAILRRQAYRDLHEAAVRHLAGAPANVAETILWLSERYGMNIVLGQNHRIYSEAFASRRATVSALRDVVADARKHAEEWGTVQEHEAEIERGRKLLAAANTPEE